VSVPSDVIETDDSCPECGPHGIIIVDESRGERSCCSCGLVIDQVFATGPEWRAYNSSEESSRARSSAPSFLNEDLVGSQTEISSSKIDARGRVLPSERRFEFSRLSNLDKRSSYSEIRNLRIAFRELKRLKSQCDIPDTVAKTASVIYRKSLKASLVRGRSIDGIVSASLYLACRRESIPITLKDIQAKANVLPKELGRCVRILLVELKLTKLSISDPASFLHRLADTLGISMATRQIGCSIIDRAKKASLTVGKNPMSIAAAALYIAGVQTGERRTQAQMANAAKTTPVTIRNRFKELMTVLKLDLEIKRGAAAVPVYVKDQIAFTKSITS
jgi:transcription initiation factor TFIIB